MPILSTLLFLFYYGLIFACCGAFTIRLLKCGYGNRPDDDQAFRQNVAAFLVGGGFTPWVIGLVQDVFLILYPGMRFGYFKYAHLLFGIILCCSMVDLPPLSRQSRRLRDLARGEWFTVLALFLTLLVFGGYSFDAMMQPIWHGDTVGYVVESKAFIENPDYQARLRDKSEHNPKNYMRYNDHPITYITYINAASSFSDAPANDLPVRAALQVQFLTFMVVLFAVGMRFRAHAGLLACLSILGISYYPALIYMSSRTVFQMIAAFMPLGLVRLDEHDWRGGRFLLYLLLMIFLFNSHSNGLLIAPTLAGCFFLLQRGWKGRLAWIAILVLGLLIGSSHQLTAFLKTGDPFHYEFINNDLLRIRTPQIWSAPAAVENNFLLRPFNLFKSYFSSDGFMPFVFIFLSPLLYFATKNKTCYERIWPAGLLFLGIYLAYTLSLFDWAYKLSVGFHSVARYRVPVYALAGLLTSVFLTAFAEQSKLYLVGKKYITLLLLVVAIPLTLYTWQREKLPYFVSNNDLTLKALGLKDSCWYDVKQYIDQHERDRNFTIITGSPFIPWYYTDYNILSILDPSLKPLRQEVDYKNLLIKLDTMSVKYFVWNKSNIISGSAFEDLVIHGCYVKVGDFKYDTLFERAKEGYCFR